MIGGKVMEYSIERVHNIFGTFWVVYEDEGEAFERVAFSSRDFQEAIKVYRTLRGE